MKPIDRGFVVAGNQHFPLIATGNGLLISVSLFRPGKKVAGPSNLFC